jgi:hypothetical protein
VAGGAGRRSAAGHAANAGTNTSGAGGLYPIRRIVLAGDRRFIADTILGSFDTRNWRDQTDRLDQGGEEGELIGRRRHRKLDADAAVSNAAQPHRHTRHHHA